MSLLEVRDVSKKFRRQSFPAVDGVSFSLQEAEILALVGASGSGKTTILRMLAGLERPDSGELSLGGKVIASEGYEVAAEKRGVGMVFQNHALFPHLTVEKNVRFGLGKISKEERRSLVEELLGMVGLEGKERRFPHELSGGERQRVALARALAPRPKLLLMDEPFSSLDMRLRQSVRDETREILRRRGTAAVFVTHDTEDALAIADRIVVMRDGRVQQEGAPQEIYHAAANPYVASFFGSCNFLPFHRLSALDAARVSCHFGPPGKSFGRTGMWVRPEHLLLGKAEDGAPGLIAEVDRVSFAGSHQKVFLKCDDGLPIEVRHQGGFLVEKGQKWKIVPRGSKI